MLVQVHCILGEVRLLSYLFLNTGESVHMNKSDDSCQTFMHLSLPYLPQHDFHDISDLARHLKIYPEAACDVCLVVL